MIRIPILVAWLLMCLAHSTFASSAVIVSEVVSNNTKFDDEDTDSSDWLEIQNTSDEAVTLDGYYLTNSKENLTMWSVPTLTLAPRAYRVIFASGKDRSLSPATIENGFLHTNFTLSAEGGYVALVEPDGETLANEIEFPKLQKNVAYVLDAGALGYAFPATPGSENSRPQPMPQVPKVEFSHQGGLISESIELTLSVPDHPEAKIEYVIGLEGEPSLFTPKYTGPIQIDGNIVIRAQAKLPDHLPSRINSCGFVMMDESLSSFAETGSVFESNLPLIVIHTFGENVTNASDFKPTYVSVLNRDAETGRTVLTGKADFQGPSGVHLRGESSRSFGQKSFSLEIRDDDGEDHDEALLGMPAESDWALYGPWSEKSLIRNKLIFDWMRELRGADGTSMRAEFCELFLSQSDSETVGYDSYQGIYLLMEKIKRGANRVPLANLNEYTTDPDRITGGFIIRKDKTDTGKSNWNAQFPLQSFDPDKFNSAQLDYAKSYISRFENALRSDDFDDPKKGYRAYIDVGTFIDAQWMVEVAKQVDGYVFSTYWHKDRNGKLRAGPLWDFNISLGNANYGSGEQDEGWLYNGRNGVGQLWYPSLHRDPEYVLAHWDRYWHMRQRFLSEEAVTSRVEGYRDTLLDGYSEPVGNREPESIQNPVARHFRKYPRIGTYDWPNPGAETRMESYQDEVEYLKDWLLDRLDWLDDEGFNVDGKIHRAPIFSSYGHASSEPVTLEISRYEGTLFNRSNYPDAPFYYTTDGTDPRMVGGEMNPAAKVYEEPLVLGVATTVTARMLNGETWSPKTSATFQINTAAASASNLTVSEIMYHPEGPTSIESFGGFKNGGVFEFIELTNTSAGTIDLTGAKFTRGISFDFASVSAGRRILAPGQSVLLVANLDGFLRRNRGFDEDLILGEYKGKLANAGERLTLADANGEDIVDFSYDDDVPWDVGADGGGFSLVRSSLAVDADLDSEGSWGASAEKGGDPGTAPESDGGGVIDTNVDSDEDGVSDFIETAMGSDPNDPHSIYFLEVSAEGADVIAAYRRSATSNATFTMESSRDLTSWEAVGDAFVAEPVIDQGDGTRTESFRRAANDDQAIQFLRLKIESNE